MPVRRRLISVSQFAELLGVEPQQVIAVERQGSSLVLVLEPEVSDGWADGRDIPAVDDGRQDCEQTQIGQQDIDERREEKDGVQLLAP